MKRNRLTVLGLILTASLALSLTGCSQNHSGSENQTVTESSEKKVAAKKKNGKVAKAQDISESLLYTVAQTDNISTFLRSEQAPSEEDMYTEIQLPDSEEAVYLWAEVAKNNDVNLKYYSEADTIITKITTDMYDSTPINGLKAIEIPDGTTEIGDHAFWACDLEYITIPGSVKVIGKGAFWDCNLKNIILEEGVEEIGQDAFKENRELTDVSIPGSVKIIGREAFADCYSLENVQLNEGLEEIGIQAFNMLHQKSKITELTIPSTVKKIGEDAFSDCALTNLVIKGGVEEIGDRAFGGCIATNLTLEEGTEKIGAYAFSRAPLKEVVIPSTVTFIGVDAFKKAEKVIIPEGTDLVTGRLNTPNLIIQNDSLYMDDYGVVYNKDKTSLLFTTKDIEGMYTIPEGVSSIPSRAFERQDKMTGITFPSSLTEIGDHAFTMCESLTKIVLPNSVNRLGKGAFSVCTNLTHATLSDNMTFVPKSAFSGCESLQVVNLGKGITQLEKYSFERCPVSEIHSGNRKGDIYCKDARIPRDGIKWICPE